MIVMVSFFAKKRGRSFWLWLVVQTIIVFIVPTLVIGVSGGDGIASKVLVIAALSTPIFIFFAQRYFSKARQIVATETSNNDQSTRNEDGNISGSVTGAKKIENKKYHMLEIKDHRLSLISFTGPRFSTSIYEILEIKATKISLFKSRLVVSGIDGVIFDGETICVQAEIKKCSLEISTFLGEMSADERRKKIIEDCDYFNKTQEERPVKAPTSENKISPNVLINNEAKEENNFESVNVAPTIPSPNLWRPFLSSIVNSKSDLFHYQEYLTSKFLSYIKLNRPKCNITSSDINGVRLWRIPYVKFHVDITFKFSYQSGEFNEIGYKKAMERYEVPYQIWQQSMNDWRARYGKNWKFGDPTEPRAPRIPSKDEFIQWGEMCDREDRIVFSENLWGLSDSGVPMSFVNASSSARGIFDLRPQSNLLFPADGKFDYLINGSKRDRMKSKVTEFTEEYYSRNISNPVILKENLQSEVFEWLVVKCDYKSGDAIKSLYLDPLVDYVQGDLPVDRDAVKRWIFFVIAWVLSMWIVLVVGKFDRDSNAPIFWSLFFTVVSGGMLTNLSKSKNPGLRKMAEKVGFWENRSLPKDKNRFTSY